MADNHSTSQRHNNMAAIHSKDTKPEIIVRKWLWNRGFRYRLTHRRLPGKPDLVLRKYRTCIFVNGCFWHGHMVEENGNPVACRFFKMPKTNETFWQNKISRNQERDKEVQLKLAQMGWHCITIWECELKPARREATLLSLEYTLNHILLEDFKRLHPYSFDDSNLSFAAETER